MPVLLALLLGLQHALAMLAGVITVCFTKISRTVLLYQQNTASLLIAGENGVNLGPELQQYLVSTSLIVSGILSSIQITRFHIYKTPYYLGTGLLSVVGITFATITVASGAFEQMYDTGYCPSNANGNSLPCPQGYGALLGTSCCAALLETLISFTPPRIPKRIFPPLVTGPNVTLIGVSLIRTGSQDWAGGSGTCSERPSAGLYRLCPATEASHALPWGSVEFIGLGFLVFVTILLCERFGAPIMKSAAVVIELLVGCKSLLPTRYSFCFNT